MEPQGRLRLQRLRHDPRAAYADRPRVGPKGDRKNTGGRRSGSAGSRATLAPQGTTRPTTVSSAINPLGWRRTVISHLPPDGGGGAPYNFLDATFLDNYRDTYPLSTAEAMPRTLRTQAPPCSTSRCLPSAGRWLDAGKAAALAEVRTGDGWANAWYRIEVDPATGGLRSWFDKPLGRELAGNHGPWRLGQYVYELVDDPVGREAIFVTNFRIERYGIPLSDTRSCAKARRPWTDWPRSGRWVQGHPVCPGAPGAESVRLRYVLPHHEKALHLDMVVDKTAVIDPEFDLHRLPAGAGSPGFSP